MKTLTAIETTYGGCRFRSRLEARWAVFFDTLDVSWQYEPQGYTVGPNATPYLPDFWLPGMGLWVEVKGQLEQDGLETLIWAASGAGLPLSPGGPPAAHLYPRKSRILVLGSIPAPGDAWLHHRLDVVADDLVVQQPVLIAPLKRGGVATIAVFDFCPLNQFVAGQTLDAGYRRILVDGQPGPFVAPFPRVTDAYRAARSARFEHGEHGAAA